MHVQDAAINCCYVVVFERDIYFAKYSATVVFGVKLGKA